MPLSVIILTHNEQHNIAECIQSVDFADEILVIDDYSTDNTVKIARELNATVIERALNGDFAAQRNFALSHATHDWVLFLDADERITEPLAQEIKQVIQNNQQIACKIRRLNHFQHRPVRHGTLKPDFVTRLFPKNGVQYVGQVHESPQHAYPTQNLKHSMLHFTYESWQQYLHKLNQYATLSAVRYRTQNKRVSFLKDIVLRPLWAFLRVYVFHLGFLDGKVGYLLAVNHYFYTLQKYQRLYDE
ncbi:MAG: glycosyltransferase family 2 protein [Neisseriaceae bacterium]|nr:glycosyltransferase family 2 protein [Neisseriaceae bacterium]